MNISASLDPPGGCIGSESTLYEGAVQHYEALGLTVVPARDKRPLVQAWRGYQQQSIAPQHFDFNSVAQIGVVLQAGWLCVDLDNAERVRQFRAAWPLLWETRRERTPKGYHLWYRMPVGAVSLTHRDGVDFLTVGSFCIVAPSPGYVLEHDVEPMHLTPLYCKALPMWLAGLGPYATSDAHVSAQNGYDEVQASVWRDDDLALRPTEIESETLADDSADLDLSSVDGDALRRVYLLRCGQGRNNALFSVASVARDKGLSLEQTKVLLLNLHVMAPAPVGHARETPEQRQREGERTIESAYRYQPKTEVKRTLTQLPAAAMQRLYQLGMKALARQLAACYAADLTQATKNQLAALTSEWTMRQAMKSNINGQVVFLPCAPEAASPPTTPQATLVSESAEAEKTNVICTGSKPSGNHTAGRRGRPAVVYVVPGVETVCEWLGVSHTAVDEVSVEAAGSVSGCNTALMKGLIRRNAGVKGRSTAWQAQVFGVSVSTIKRWRRQAGVISKNIGEAVTWRNFKRFFLDEERICEHWMQDEAGKRYPAQRVIAAKLLKAGKRLTYHTRKDYVYYLKQTLQVIEQYASQNPPIETPKAQADDLHAQRVALMQRYGEMVREGWKQLTDRAYNATLTAPVGGMADVKASDDHPLYQALVQKNEEVPAKRQPKRGFQHKYWEHFENSKAEHSRTAAGVQMGAFCISHAEYADLQYLCDGYNQKWKPEETDRARCTAGLKVLHKVRDYLLDIDEAVCKAKAQRLRKNRQVSVWEKQYSEPLINETILPLEDRAQALYKQVNALVPDSSQRMSIYAARWMYATRSACANQALREFEAVVEAGREIANPVGYVLAIFKRLQRES